MDLSRLPEPVRSRLEEQLSRLPPEVRAGLEKKLANLPTNQLEAVLARTAPMLEKLGSKPPPPPRGRTGSGDSPGTGGASQTGSRTGEAPRPQSVFDQHNHYNNTIHRGDREGPPLFVILFLVACAIVFLQSLGLFNS